MTEYFNANFFTENRKKLKIKLDGTPAVFTAYGSLQKAQDTTYEFTQDGNFWYLTGLNDPDVLLVMDGQEEYLIVPDLSPSKIYFDGDLVDDELQRISGIKKVLSQSDGMDLLRQLVEKTDTIATLQPAPSYIDQLGMYTNPSRQQLHATLKKMKKSIKLNDCREQIARLRMVKQTSEIAALQEAIDITCNGVALTMQKYLNGTFQTERQVELFLRESFYAGNGDGHAFEPIVASGSSSCTIHPVVSKAPIGGNSLLVDVGAAVSMYKADISRSWSVEPTERYISVLRAVKEVSDYAMSQLKPGISLREYEKSVERYMGKQLKQLGLIKSATRTNIRSYFPHLTSHFLGIDVHDVGVYDEPLAAGCVITVEPGIYIKDEGIGIRIENDVLLTGAGCKNLSASLADLQPNL